MTHKKIFLICVAAVVLVTAWLYFVKGYVCFRTRDAVPVDLINEARIPGMDNIRIIADPLMPKASDLRTEIFRSKLSRPHFTGKEANVLVISGGGANGAYAAGILCGWTEAGTRPDFDIVTGVSTGALIAPCAFAGSSYDQVIRNIYTRVSTADIVTANVAKFLFGERPSIVDTAPLMGILEKNMTMDLMKDVAREHALGRRLYIATTNLDARRLVIWDMGAIASVGTPEALELFRKVMLASASIPAAFPPVMMTVEAGGKLYDEMHVDGSVATQMFGVLLFEGPVREDDVKTHVYLIRNGKIADMPREVKPKIWDIAGSAFSTLMTWQSYSDLYRFAVAAKQDGMDLRVAFIPYDFDPPRSTEFDNRYMNELFDLGYASALSGDQWYNEFDDLFSQYTGKANKGRLQQ